MPEKNSEKNTNKKKGSLPIRKGDRVKVISGKDRGLIGEVIAVYPERNKVTVAGVNIVRRHLRDTAAQPQARQTTKGGIVSSEAPIHASNVQLVARIGYDRVEVTKRRPDGSEYKSTRSVRIARATGEEI
jgi:large subunit ribosomal protein L24